MVFFFRKISSTLFFKLWIYYEFNALFPWNTNLFTHLIINHDLNGVYLLKWFNFLGENCSFFEKAFVNLKNIGIGRFGFAFFCFSKQLISYSCFFKFKFCWKTSSFRCELRVQMPSVFNKSCNPKAVYRVRFLNQLLTPLQRRGSKLS